MSTKPDILFKCKTSLLSSSIHYGKDVNLEKESVYSEQSNMFVSHFLAPWILNWNLLPQNLLNFSKALLELTALLI